MVIEIQGGSQSPGAKLVMANKKPGKCGYQAWYCDPQGFLHSCLNDLVPYAGDGQAVVMKPASGDPKGQWFIDGAKIVSRAGPVMDVRGANKNEGAEVIAYKFNKQVNQAWDQGPF